MIALNETEKKWVDEMWERLDKKLSKTCISARGKLPYTTVNGVFDDKQGEDKRLLGRSDVADVCRHKKRGIPQNGGGNGRTVRQGA